MPIPYMLPRLNPIACRDPLEQCRALRDNTTDRGSGIQYQFPSIGANPGWRDALLNG